MSDSEKKGAELLLQGAKMLSIPCPDCSTPIFLLKSGLMICTSCDKTVVKEGELEEIKINNKTNPIQDKIELLSEQLLHEKDADKILEIATLIKNLQNLIK